MKARHIRTLRKRIGKMKTYEIRTSTSIFGDFFGYNRTGLVMGTERILAPSPLKAIERFMKRYRRRYKRMNDYEKDSYSETVERWGAIMVVDERGYRRFFS